MAKTDVECYTGFSMLLQVIDSFIERIVENVDRDCDVYIVSDHDFHTYRKALNIYYPLMFEFLDISISTKSVVSLKRSIESIVNSRYYKRIALSSAIARKLLLSSIARVVRGRIEVKSVFVAEECIGLYLSKQLMKKKIELVDVYRSHGIPVMLNTVFWGSYVDELPDLIVDFRKLPRDIGIYRDLVYTPYTDVLERNHYPYGILIPISDSVNTRYIPKTVSPWDIAVTILASITKRIPSNADGKCINGITDCSDTTLDSVDKKIIVLKKLKKVKE